MEGKERDSQLSEEMVDEVERKGCSVMERRETSGILRQYKGGYMKYVCTNACSLGYKQEDLELEFRFARDVKAQTQPIQVHGP